MASTDSRPPSGGVAALQSQVHVCPLAEVERVVISSRATRLLTVINEDTIPATPAGLHPDRHLKIGVNDITEPRLGYIHPADEHIARILDFARGWNHDGAMVVHCWAGISRSTAAAYISLCALNPDGAEEALAQALRRASPTATPNALMIEIADSLLGRGGRMTAAIAAIGRGAPAMTGTPFILPSRITCD